MGALSDFLIQARGAAVPAVPAVLSSVAVPQPEPDLAEPQEPQEPQGVAVEMRAKLLRLAAAEKVDAAHVHRLHADDVAAYAGEPDETLRACLRALARGAAMDSGTVPVEYTQRASCEGCGPVWLWPTCPPVVQACPWCFRRKAGKAFPSPHILCGDCRHYLPDPLNPAAGVGACGIGKGPANWPMKRHRCPDMRPILTREPDLSATTPGGVSLP